MTQLIISGGESIALSILTLTFALIYINMENDAKHAHLRIFFFGITMLMAFITAQTTALSNPATFPAVFLNLNLLYYCLFFALVSVTWKFFKAVYSSEETNVG